jgi:hypothetical protein
LLFIEVGRKRIFKNSRRTEMKITLSKGDKCLSYRDGWLLAKVGRWVAKFGRWVAKSGRWMAKLGRWVAKSSGRWVATLGRWEAKLVTRLLATAALWFESRYLSKTQNGQHKQRIGENTLTRQKNLQKKSVSKEVHSVRQEDINNDVRV